MGGNGGLLWLRRRYRWGRRGLRRRLRSLRWCVFAGVFAPERCQRRIGSSVRWPRRFLLTQARTILLCVVIEQPGYDVSPLSRCCEPSLLALVLELGDIPLIVDLPCEQNGAHEGTRWEGGYDSRLLLGTSGGTQCTQRACATESARPCRQGRCNHGSGAGGSIGV